MDGMNGAPFLPSLMQRTTTAPGEMQKTFTVISARRCRAVEICLPCNRFLHFTFLEMIGKMVNPRAAAAAVVDKQHQDGACCCGCASSEIVARSGYYNQNSEYLLEFAGDDELSRR